MIWRDFERSAPELARAAQARFEASRLALLGTLRADGSPRISPVEPFFASDHLLFGAMTRSLKARDLARDPRCVLHSVVSDPDAGEQEFKLYGAAVTSGDERDSRPDAWWTSHPPDAARVFSLDVQEAAAVAWAIERGEMTVTRWSATRGLEQETRSYP
jgi:hypothetical protein